MPDLNHLYLKELYLNYNYLSSIGEIPETLTRLHICNDNFLKSLPEKVYTVKYRYVHTCKYPRWLKYNHLVRKY